MRGAVSVALVYYHFSGATTTRGIKIGEEERHRATLIVATLSTVLVTVSDVTVLWCV